jgi:hypothetical protein
MIVIVPLFSPRSTCPKMEDDQPQSKHSHLRCRDHLSACSPSRNGCAKGTARHIKLELIQKNTLLKQS